MTMEEEVSVGHLPVEDAGDVKVTECKIDAAARRHKLVAG